MAFCANCGFKVQEYDKFCPRCGVATRKDYFSDTNNNSVRKESYDGEIIKCPNCGEVLNSFTPNCPSCGYEIRKSNHSSCVNDLANKLEKTESLDERIELIKNFYIPNTKEDIYEFIILAAANIENEGADVLAWQVKLDQAYQKAEFVFGNTPEFGFATKLYNKANKKRQLKKVVNIINIVLKFASMIAIALISNYIIQNGVETLRYSKISLHGGDRADGIWLIILGSIVLLTIPVIAIFWKTKIKNLRGK